MQQLIESYKNTKTSGLQRKRPQLYTYLVDTTPFLASDAHITTTQRLWHHWNNVWEIPKCLACKQHTKWDVVTQTYRQFCSKRCAGVHKTTVNNQHTIQHLCIVCKTNNTRFDYKNQVYRETCSVQCRAQLNNINANTEKTVDEIIKFVESLPPSYNYRKFRGQYADWFVQIMKHTNNLPNSYQIKQRIQWLQGTITTKAEYASKKITELCPINNGHITTVSMARALSRSKSTTCPVCGSPRLYNSTTNRYPTHCSPACEEVSVKQRLTRKLISLLKTYKHSRGYVPYNKILDNRLNNKEWLIQSHHTNQMTTTDIALLLGVDRATVSNRFIEFGITQMRFATSSAETHIVTLLQTVAPDLEVITNTRTVIPPLELDIYLPALKIAIEYCGLYWHSDIHSRINNTYHSAKYTRCAALGIRLITIFEDEWIHNRSLVEQKLTAIIGRDSRKPLHARKCDIVSVSKNEKASFFDQNHIQGNGPSSINIGLVHCGKLVSAMGIISNGAGVYTINRFASSTNVRGAFSKLLRHFEQIYPDWKTIVTFADLRWSQGKLYQDNGFDLLYSIPPDYTYIDAVTKTRIHKFNFRRARLPKLLKLFDPTKSEVYNTRANGIFRIFDCGKLKYSKTNKYQ